MVEAAGVECSRDFVVVRDHANSNENLQSAYFHVGMTMHHREEFRIAPLLLFLLPGKKNTLPADVRSGQESCSVRQENQRAIQIEGSGTDLV